ncbi:MAG: histidine kinase dimerization/phospho-acceptor domain-containing protein, partial [Stenotrophobium sp.]
MILRKLWGLRFHGWPWLFVPVLLGLLLALCLMAEGVLGMPRSGTLTVCFGITLFSIVVAMIGMWAIGRPVRALLAAARALASGRAEARAPTGNWGITGELGTAINQLARQISAHGDQLDQAVTQATARLQEDVERLQAQNQEMRTALTESRGRTETLSELFSNLSHELRTPLTAVLGYTDLLRRSGLNRAQETHLATLDKSARAMLKMINDLLDWSRIEAGR